MGQLTSGLVNDWLIHVVVTAADMKAIVLSLIWLIILSDSFIAEHFSVSNRPQASP